MIPHYERITIIYISIVLKITTPIIKNAVFKGNGETQIGVFAEDTLPLMSGLTNCLDITIYTIK